MINRTNANGVVTQVMKVPLTYSVKDKMMARVDTDPNLDKSSAINLPVMAFELKSMQMDLSRKKNTLNQRVVKNPTDPDTFKYQYQSVPWNLNFNLYILVKNAEDGTKILEQILPYFKPNWDMTLNILPELGVNLDTPVYIGEPTCEDNYDDKFTTRRAIVWTVPFSMKVEYFGPIKTKKVIKFAIMNFYAGESTDPADAIGSITTQPGLTANGQPTTVAADSVDPHVIYVSDDFGFVIEDLDNVLLEGN